MRFLYLTLSVLFLSSCGATVNYDYDNTTDFSPYKSYNFYGDIDSGLSELDDKRIMRITDSLFQLKGFIKSESPQLLINFYAKEGLMNSGNSIGIGVGGGGGNIGVGVSGGIPIGGYTITQILTMDLVDTSQDRLIWKAIGEDKIKEKATPFVKDAFYTKMISKIFSGYPPE